MPAEPTIYDLMLLLSTSASEEDRAKILTDVENAIAGAGGSLERNQSWGTRPMSYRINHVADAEYHLLQFSGPPALLESLSHSLRIADEVVRFRIIKVLSGTPPAPDNPPPVVAGVAAAPGGGGPGGGGGGAVGGGAAGSGAAGGGAGGSGGGAVGGGAGAAGAGAVAEADE